MGYTLKKSSLFKGNRSAPFGGLQRRQHAWIWILFLSLVGLVGCKVGTTAPQNLNADLPQEHVSLLELQIDEVMQLEKQQRYAYLYDVMASPLLRQQSARKPFMQLVRCVETTLGPVTDVHRSQMKIRFFKKKGLYQVNLPVNRQNATIRELHHFLLQPDGKLAWAGLYWQTNRKDFLDCTHEVANINIWHPPKPATNKTSLKP